MLNAQEMKPLWYTSKDSKVHHVEMDNVLRSLFGNGDNQNKATKRNTRYQIKTGKSNKWVKPIFGSQDLETHQIKTKQVKQIHEKVSKH